MKKTSLFLGVLLSIFTWSACSNSSKDSVEQAKDINEAKDSSNAVMAMDENDAKFMVDAADASMREIEMANLAKQRSTDTHVIEYSVTMVRDHTQVNNELKSLAAVKNVTLPAAMSEESQKHVSDMRDKSPKDFDKDYMDMMVKDHKDAINRYERIAENGKDADLRAWASTTLMTLRLHKDSAEYVQKQVKDKK